MKKSTMFLLAGAVACAAVVGLRKDEGNAQCPTMVSDAIKDGSDAWVKRNSVPYVVGNIIQNQAREVAPAVDHQPIQDNCVMNYTFLGKRTAQNAVVRTVRGKLGLEP
jgi:hypothetical protein